MVWRACGVRVRREQLVRSPYDHDAAQRAAESLLAQPERPTAILCGNDVIALGVASAAKRLGIAVPDRLTIVGFDDIPMAGWPLIDLTTVRCDRAALARKAVGMLVQRMV